MTSRLRAALPTAALALVLALTGCEQPQEANDNGPEADPVQPGGVTRTPEPVEEAPLTTPLPGESNSPNVPSEQDETADPQESNSS